MTRGGGATRARLGDRADRRRPPPRARGRARESSSSCRSTSRSDRSKRPRSRSRSTCPTASRPRRSDCERNLRQRPDGRWVWKHSLGRISRERMQRIEDTDWEHDILVGLDEDAATIQAPVLVLRGASSDVLSSDGADRGRGDPAQRSARDDRTRPVTSPPATTRRRPPNLIRELPRRGPPTTTEQVEGSQRHGSARRQGRHRHRRGPGSGRTHALLLASEGARVVVNDLGR